MHRLLILAVALLLAAPAAEAQQPGTDFVTVVFHDVVATRAELQSDSISTSELIRFFDWLKGNGWTPISLDDLDAARRGARPLPPKAILLTFDDAYQSFYTQVYPLLLAYRYPAMVALVGSWMAGAPGSLVEYGDRQVPRETFLSWAELREMSASGLVEVASHSFDLHQAIPGNPQGNLLPAGSTWAYDPKTGRYEDDDQYRARIRQDLAAAREQIARELGRPPRALVWPFGRYTGPAIAEARAAGFIDIFTLAHAPDSLDRLDEIGRLYPVAADQLRDIATELRFEPPKAETVRIACLALDGIAPQSGAAAQDEALGAMVAAVQRIGANVVVIDAGVALPSPTAPLRAVYFPTTLRPVAADLLGRAVWQMRTRAGVDAVYLRLPLRAARAAVGEAALGRLYADMYRFTAADGLVLDAAPGLAAAGTDGAPSSSAPWDLAARRRVFDPASLSGDDKDSWIAWQAAFAIEPRLRLMLMAPTATPTTRWPAPLADLLLLPPTTDTGGLARALRSRQWLQPAQSGRVVLTLPDSSIRAMTDAMRAAQAEGATAFAFCPPGDRMPLPDLDAAEIARLSATFSAASFPLTP